MFFLLSLLLTGVFISQKFWLYGSINAMIASCCIAGGKWLIQIVAVLIFLKEKKWDFICRIGLVCFTGSVVLFVYNIFIFLPIPIGGFSQFVFAVGLSVLVMIAMYYKAVAAIGISKKWFWGWMVCLAVAILLQVNLCFNSY